METLKIELGERVTSYLAGIGNPVDRYYLATWLVEDWRFAAIGATFGVAS